MYGYIYKITNKLNDLKYIGKHSYSFDSLDPQYITSGKIINKAIDKNGIDNFTIELIDTADSLLELNEKEIYWIKYYNTYLGEGYNLTPGGDGGNTVKDKIKITNGLVEQWYPKDKSLPNGYWIGTKQFGRYHPLFGRSYLWASNGIEEVQIDLSDLDKLSDYKNKGYAFNKRLPMKNNQKILIAQHHNTYKENFSKETLDFYRQNWIGNNNPNVKNPKYGKLNSFYGKHHTEESKRINSEKHKIKYKCPYCDYISNKGGITKHINKSHKNSMESATTIENITYEKYVE